MKCKTMLLLMLKKRCISSCDARLVERQVARRLAQNGIGPNQRVLDVQSRVSVVAHHILRAKDNLPQRIVLGEKKSYCADADGFCNFSHLLVPKVFTSPLAHSVVRDRDRLIDHVVTRNGPASAAQLAFRRGDESVGKVNEFFRFALKAGGCDSLLYGHLCLSLIDCDDVNQGVWIDRK